MSAPLRRRARAAALLALVLADVDAALAHERRRVGNLVLEVGWAQEPVLTDVPNAVEVAVEVAGGEFRGSLGVEALFGDEASDVRSGPLKLEADDDGVFHAPLVPTRPGAYTFVISGESNGKPFEEAFEVEEARTSGEAQFPARDPSRGEIAERLERIDERLAQGEGDPVARALGGAALALAAAGLWLALRRRRTA